MRRVARIFFGGAAALVAGVALVSAAGAVTVKPIDASIVDSVDQVVPLSADGSEIAFSATRPTSRYLSDSIYVANADGSDMRRVGVLNGRFDVGIFGLTASGDDQWLAYKSGGTYASDSGAEIVGRPHAVGIVNVTSGALRRVRFSNAADTDAILAGRTWFYAIPENGAAVRINAQTGSVRNVPRVGSGASVRPPYQAWNPSEDRQEAGFCSATGLSIARLTVGLLDRAAGVIRTATAHLRPAGGCQVSDDGSTVATVGLAHKTSRILVLRRRRTRVVTVGHGLTDVMALSPSGRYALLGSGDPSINTNGKVALVDLDREQVHIMRGAASLGSYMHNDYYTAVAAWSSDEKSAVAVSTHWKKLTRGNGSTLAGRLIAVSTQTGATHFLARLVAPAGTPFDGTPVPQAFTDDGQAVGVTVSTTSQTTDAVPYRVPLNGTAATLLFSSSVRSYGSVARSPDKSHAWISAGYTCSHRYRFPLMSLTSEDPWASPWRAQ